MDKPIRKVEGESLSLQKADQLIKAKRFNAAAKEIYAYMDKQKKKE